MPVEILVTSSDYFNQFVNDKDYSGNLSETTPNLAGLVMENHKYLQQVDIEWFAQATPGNVFNVSGSGTRVDWNGNFFADGFSVGDEIVLRLIDSNNVETSTHTGTIASLSESVMVLDAAFVPALPAGDSDYGGNSRIQGVSWLTALIYRFGLIGNNENYNNISKVSQNSQSYYAPSEIGEDTGGGVRSTAFVDMIKRSQYSDWITGTARVRFISNPTTYVQRFEIEHIFMINPFYKEGELVNLQQSIVREIFKGDNSIKYAQEYEWRTSNSNPNSSKIQRVDNILGSVGDFGENFNGFQNNYEVLSVAYEEEATANSADGLLISTKTKTTIVVRKKNGNFSGNDRVIANISYLASESEYTNTVNTTLKENFIYDNALADGGGSDTGDVFITDLTVGSSVTDELTVTIESLYPLSLQMRLSLIDQPKFLIGLIVGDKTLSAGASDRVNLLVAPGIDYDVNADIPGLMAVTNHEYFPHDRTIGIDTGYTNFFGWNEDGLAIPFQFSLDLNKNAFLNSLSYVVMAFKDSDNSYFLLDEYLFEISNAIISNGAQQINIDTERNYNLVSGSQFNKVQLLTESQAAGIQNYSGIIGQKIPWQDWIRNNDVDTVFFDTLQPQDNLNFKTSNYSGLNGYTIRTGLLANIRGTSELGVTGNTLYLFKSPTIIIYNYDEDGNVTSIWAGVLQTFRRSNMELLGTGDNFKILQGEETLVRWTWTNSAGPITELGNIWSHTNIEETGQLGEDIDECSTNRPVPATNRLIPKDNDTQLDMYIDSGNVVTECVTNINQIREVPYNISGRIQDPETPIDTNTKFTSPDNSVKDLAGVSETKEVAI